MRGGLACLLTSVMFIGSCNAAIALQSVTRPFNVSMDIITSCVAAAQGNLAFGAFTIISAQISQTLQIAVKCTRGVPYRVGLGNGSHFAGGTRRMQSAAGNYVNYNLTYQNAPWDLVNTISGVGAGGNQIFRGAGVVPLQNYRPGVFSDVVQIVVSY